MQIYTVLPNVCWNRRKNESDRWSRNNKCSGAYISKANELFVTNAPRWLFFPNLWYPAVCYTNKIHCSLFFVGRIVPMCRLGMKVKFIRRKIMKNNFSPEIVSGFNLFCVICIEKRAYWKHTFNVSTFQRTFRWWYLLFYSEMQTVNKHTEIFKMIFCIYWLLNLTLKCNIWSTKICYAKYCYKNIGQLHTFDSKMISSWQKNKISFLVSV